MRYNRVICLLLFITLLLCLSTVTASDITDNNAQETVNSHVTVESSQELADTINDDSVSSDNLNIRLDGNGKTYDLDEIDGINIDSNQSFNRLTIDGNNNIIKSSDSYISTRCSKTLIPENIIFTGSPSINNWGITKVINCTFRNITTDETIFTNINQEVYIDYVDGVDNINTIDTEGILEIYNSTFDNLTLTSADDYENIFISNLGTNIIVSGNIFTNCNSIYQNSSLIKNHFANMTLSNNVFKQNNLATLIDNNYNVDDGEDDEAYPFMSYILNNTFDSNKYSNALIQSNNYSVIIQNNKFSGNVKLQNDATAVKIYPQSQQETLNQLLKNNNIFSDNTKYTTFGKASHVKTFSTTKQSVKKSDNNSYRNYMHTFKKDEVITLAKLNELFNRDFTNMHLLIYIDNVLVFNSTVSDDLSMILFKLEDILTGHHILKVIISDQEDNNTYQREIYIN